jgi:hypothetical protein
VVLVFQAIRRLSLNVLKSDVSGNEFICCATERTFRYRVKLSLGLIKHNTMKDILENGGIGPCILNLITDVGEWSASCLANLLLGKLPPLLTEYEAG